MTDPHIPRNTSGWLNPLFLLFQKKKIIQPGTFLFSSPRLYKLSFHPVKNLFAWMNYKLRLWPLYLLLGSTFLQKVTHPDGRFCSFLFPSSAHWPNPACAWWEKPEQFGTHRAWSFLTYDTGLNSRAVDVDTAYVTCTIPHRKVDPVTESSRRQTLTLTEVDNFASTLSVEIDTFYVWQTI